MPRPYDHPGLVQFLLLNLIQKTKVLALYNISYHDGFTLNYC
jgi:hypothetical protein